MRKPTDPLIYTPSGRAGEYADKGYAANLYSGCPHRCDYCYARSISRKTAEQFAADVHPVDFVLERLARDVEGKHFDEPIFLCFMCDPYPAIEEQLQITRRAIEIIKASGNNVRILTKNGPLAKRDFDLLGPGDEFGVTLTCLYQDDSWEWEPDASLPHQRASALKDAHQRGIRTWASMEPVVDPEQSLALIEASARFVDVFKVGTLNHHKHARTIDWAEFGMKAITLLEKLGKEYYIKADLREHLPLKIKAIVNVPWGTGADNVPRGTKCSGCDVTSECSDCQDAGQ